MATLLETRPASKSTAAPAWVDPNTLPYGTKVTLLDTPGVFRVVREAQMGNDGHFRVRVRELADNGSLVGPVRSVRPRDVASIVGDGPKAEAEETDEIVSPVSPPPTADEPRPLVVACVISIGGTHYSVSPLAPAPGATKAYRFNKIDGDEAQHDLDETADGASCTCGSFVWRHDGLDDLGCKHVRAARMLGLIAEAPEPTPARTAYDDAREKLARIAEDEAVVRREGVISNDTPARVAAVPATCCPDDEPLPCAACLTHEGPGDASDDGWMDDARWELGPDDDEPFAAWIARQAEAFATIGTPRAKWLAGKIAELAERARWLDAASPDAFDDRLQAQLDAAADAAEARQRAACC
jgi:hypothetical protein